MHPEAKNNIIEEIYEYCSIIDIDNDDSIYIGILGKGVMPNIKLS